MARSVILSLPLPYVTHLGAELLPSFNITSGRFCQSLMFRFRVIIPLQARWLWCLTNILLYNLEDWIVNNIIQYKGHGSSLTWINRINFITGKGHCLHRDSMTLMYLHFIARVVSASFGRDAVRGPRACLLSFDCAEGAAAGCFRGWAQKEFLQKAQSQGCRSEMLKTATRVEVGAN